MPRRGSLRVVMFVLNDVRRDSRVLREARTLVEAGHQVTVMGRTPQGTRGGRDEGQLEGFRVVRLPIPHGWRFWWTWLVRPWDRWRYLRNRAVKAVRGPVARMPLELAIVGAMIVGTVLLTVVRAPLARLGRRRPSSGVSTADWLATWRWAILPWARLVAREAPDADVWHGHDLTALPAAVAAARERGGTVIYDSHEIYLAAGTAAARPRWARWLLATYERRLARHAAALVTVNTALEPILAQRLGISRRVVVHNCPPRPPDTAPGATERPGHLRAALSLPPDVPIVLYHGGFTPHRGLEELARAALEPGMEGVHVVFLGYGSLRERLAALVAAPRFGGRLHLVDAVPPDVLVDWVADADIAAMPIHPSTLNHRLSTPNKLFESLTAGVPVVASDLPGMRPIVMDDPAGPLGELCDPADPASIAAAVRRILERSPVELAELRARCRRAAVERWNWETESSGLVALYEELAEDGAAGADAGARAGAGPGAGAPA